MSERNRKSTLIRKMDHGKNNIGTSLISPGKLNGNRRKRDVGRRKRNMLQ